MKIVVNFILLLSLVSLVSCGAKKSGMTLRVSNSMAISNSSFDGGLVFFGRSTTGKIFSAPVAYGAGSGNQIEIELDRGDWTFGAIGWNGSASVFKGTSKCATITTNLDSAEQTINLNLTETGCTDSFFGGNNVVNNFKSFHLTTCGTFYTDITTPLAAFTNNKSYCSNAITTLHSEMKDKAKSARIFIPVIVPGFVSNTSSPLSECVNLTDGAFTTTLKLPAKGLPIQIELFDGICADTNKEILAGYVMPNGFDTSYPSFDHKYQNDTGSTNVFLLATISRRGTSSLLDSMPKFVCNGGSPNDPCSRIPYVSTLKRVIAKDTFFFFKDQGNDSCASSTATIDSTTFGSAWNPAINCRESGGKIFVKLTSANLSPSYCVSSCALAVTFTHPAAASTTTSLDIAQAANPDGLQAYDLIFRTVGYQDVLSVPLGDSTLSELSGYLSLGVFHEDEDKNQSEKKFFGHLSKVREMLMPSALGGIFQGMTATDLNSKSINLSFWDEGVQKSYRITSQADTSLLQNYIHIDGNASTIGNTTEKYTHRITISRIIGGAFYPQILIRIKHGSQIGMMETLDEKSDSGQNVKKIERSLLFWNTQVADNGRFEAYQFEKETKLNDASYIWNVRTSFTRAEREPAASLKNARIDNYAFESRRNGVSSNFFERGTKSAVIMSGGNAQYLSSRTDLSTTSLMGYFSEDMFKNARKSASVNDSVAFARSPTNGSKVIMAWSSFNGTTHDLQVMTKASGAVAQFYKFTTAANSPFVPKVSINDLGEPIVAWVHQNSTTYYGYALTLVGAAWKDTSGATIANNSFGATSFHNTGGSAFPFAVVDHNPTSNSANSTKTVVFHNGTSQLDQRTITSGTWAGGNVTWGSQSNIPLAFDVVLHGGVFYVYYTYVNATNYYLQVDKTTSFAISTKTAVGTSASMGATPASQAFVTINIGDTMDFYVPSHSKKWNTDGTTWSSGGTAISNFGYDTQKAPYCFARSTTTSQQLAIASVAGCKVPNTSFSAPVRSEFKFDLDSLKPNDFDNMFSL